MSALAWLVDLVAESHRHLQLCFLLLLLLLALTLCLLPSVCRGRELCWQVNRGIVLFGTSAPRRSAPLFDIHAGLRQDVIATSDRGFDSACEGAFRRDWQAFNPSFVSGLRAARFQNRLYNEQSTLARAVAHKIRGVRVCLLFNKVVAG